MKVRNNWKKIFALIMLICGVFVGVSYHEKSESLAYTQNYLETYFKCDSKTGWVYSARSKHMGSKETTYRMGSESVKALYMSYMTNGAALWGSYVDVTYSSSSMGYVYNVTDSTSNVLANTSTSAGTDGITTGWTIKINSYLFDSKSTAGKNRIIAHELGHVFGLGDLYDSADSGKIMYGIYNETSAVNTYDIKGMTVVTEAHTHASYCPVIYEKYTSSKHKVRCTSCMTYYEESHTSSSYCTKCGYSS